MSESEKIKCPLCMLRDDTDKDCPICHGEGTIEGEVKVERIDLHNSGDIQRELAEMLHHYIISSMSS